jgi:hypothetical protein
MTHGIYVDFNNRDPEGRVRLNTAGSIDDMAAQRLTPFEGMILSLYSEDLEATGTVCALAEGGWGIELDWSTVRDRGGRED